MPHQTKVQLLCMLLPNTRQLEAVRWSLALPAMSRIMRARITAPLELAAEQGFPAECCGGEAQESTCAMVLR